MSNTHSSTHRLDESGWGCNGMAGCALLTVSTHLDLAPSLGRILVRLFLQKQEAGEIVVAPSRMSLHQSAFGERRQCVGPFSVDSKRPSHGLSLLVFHFGTCHCEHNRLGILRNISGPLAFLRNHHIPLPSSGHRNTAVGELPGESRLRPAENEGCLGANLTRLCP